MELRDRVYRALDNSVENGYHADILQAVDDTGIDDVCADLTDCDADLENYEPEELWPHVISWLEQKGVCCDGYKV